MKLVTINWNPTDRQLRQFGAVCLVALPAIAWLWGGGLGAIAVLAVIGLVIALLGFAIPNALKTLFLGLTLITLPIGIVLSELALILIYFGIFLPIGLFFRLARRDALQMKFDVTQRSYWQSKKQPRNLASYYRQF